MNQETSATERDYKTQKEFKTPRTEESKIVKTQGLRVLPTTPLKQEL